MIYFLRKLIISPEMLLIFLWPYFHNLNFISNLNDVIETNLITIAGSSILAFFSVTFFLAFPKMDKKNIIKYFPNLNDFYKTIIVSIVYFIIFLLLLVSSWIENLWNLPSLGGLGIIIVLGGQSLACFHINWIIRENGD